MTQRCAVDVLQLLLLCCTTAAIVLGHDDQQQKQMSSQCTEIDRWPPAILHSVDHGQNSLGLNILAAHMLVVCASCKPSPVPCGYSSALELQTEFSYSTARLGLLNHSVGYMQVICVLVSTDFSPKLELRGFMQV